MILSFEAFIFVLSNYLGYHGQACDNKALVSLMRVDSRNHKLNVLNLYRTCREIQSQLKINKI